MLAKGACRRLGLRTFAYGAEYSAGCARGSVVGRPKRKSDVFVPPPAGADQALLLRRLKALGLLARWFAGPSPSMPSARAAAIVGESSTAVAMEDAESAGLLDTEGGGQRKSENCL